MAQLVLIRHGQSVWNLKNVFTGWVDVPLSVKGIEEAQDAGKSFASLDFDSIFTSVEIRSLETAMIAMAYNNTRKSPIVIHKDDEMKDWTKIFDEGMLEETIPVICDWHLNERYYGELQGLNKEATVKEYGEEKVHQWRRSYDVQPPKGESLKDTAARTIPFFKKNIVPLLKQGKNVLVSAHGNSLRSIVMFIENLSHKEVLDLEIPTGKPIIYIYEGDEVRKK